MSTRIRSTSSRVPAPPLSQQGGLPRTLVALEAEVVAAALDRYRARMRPALPWEPRDAAARLRALARRMRAGDLPRRMATSAERRAAVAEARGVIRRVRAALVYLQTLAPNARRAVAIERLRRDGGRSAEAMALSLEAHAAAVRRERLDEETRAMVARVPGLVARLRGLSKLRAEEMRASIRKTREAAEDLAEVRRLLRLVRGAARYVFQGEPGIVKMFTSAHERDRSAKRRRAARR